MREDYYAKESLYEGGKDRAAVLKGERVTIVEKWQESDGSWWGSGFVGARRLTVPMASLLKLPPDDSQPPREALEATGGGIVPRGVYGAPADYRPGRG